MMYVLVFIAGVCVGVLGLVCYVTIAGGEDE